MSTVFTHNDDYNDGDGEADLYSCMQFVDFYVAYDDAVDSVMFGLQLGREQARMMGLTIEQAMGLRDLFNTAIADAVGIPEGMA